MAGEREPATFRGVPFWVEAHESSHGRRTVLHEYPLRDKPYAEDMGRKARQFSVEALVLGTDYATVRNRLLDALEQPGPGKLVHPYLGELQVSVPEFKLRESTAEGGLARFTLTCVESGLAIYPAATTSSADQVDAAATRLEAAAKATFEQRYAVAEKPDYLAGDARSVLGQAMDQVSVATRSARAGADAVASITASVQAVNKEIITLVYDPASAAQALLGNVRSLISAATVEPRNALALARPFFRFGADLLPVPLADAESGPVTVSRLQQATNREQMTGAVRMAAVMEASRVASTLDFTSYDEAVTVRSELADTLDALAQSAGVSDEVYEALVALRASMVRDITSRGADLARVVSYTPALTLPALVLAHQLYGDATRDADIVARNRVRHPGFLQGNTALEVLSDA